MAETADRKKSEKEVASSGESSTGTTQPTVVKQDPDSEAHLLPFANPYNKYFEAVHEAYSTLLQSARDINGDYVKAAQAAIEARDAEALRLAGEKFSTAWVELGKPLASSVGLAFDTYHQEITSAFASGASSVLGPGCLTLVASSIATVARHRTFYTRV